MRISRGSTRPARAARFGRCCDLEQLREPLGSRVMAGFGGVAEYGITVRWDKNFLKLIRLLLERRSQFRMFGGVRFGGAMTIESAFELGFDHIALCAGAGRPTIVGMKNGLAPGVRQASDFLMALQLTGAAKTDSIANLLVRLPIAVIGGGLTAIDTATEALAYYPLAGREVPRASRGAGRPARSGRRRGGLVGARPRGGERIHRPCASDPGRARSGQAGRQASERARACCGAGAARPSATAAA